MGCVSVRVNEGQRRLSLSRSSLFGRHQICHGQLGHRDVPLHWLEVRWLGDGWGWRALNDDSSRTKGSGKTLDGGWRAFAIGSELRCGTDVCVSLEDASPPSLFALDLESGLCLEGDTLEDWVELWKGALYALGVDHEQSSPILDCEVRVLRGRALRFFVPGTLVFTDRQRLSVANPGCTLDLDPEELVAVFTVGQVDVRIKGECVRVLHAYARARLEDSIEEGGWLSRSQVFEAWKQLGGQPKSREERVGWEKGKLRTRLTTAAVGGAEGLFENRFYQGSTHSRLALPPSRVFISGN